VRRLGLRTLLHGFHLGLAGTVYGTIVVMATVTAGSKAADTDTGRLAGIVVVTVLVFWVAHVYSHALAESLRAQTRLDAHELGRIARREFALPLAAVAPTAALVLGALGVLREQTAIWLALGIGILTLAVEGARYAAIERLGGAATLVQVGINVSLGLVIVGLKVLVAH
jgi:hypothetical protein